MVILTLNCGSSSAKYQVYDWDNKDVLTVGVVERIGQEYSTIEQKSRGKEEFNDKFSSPTHAEAIDYILKMLQDPTYGCIKDLSEIGAVGHRVLHGGEMFKKSTLVTDEVIEQLKTLIPLGPLHMPGNIMGIECARKLMPNVPQAIVLDTAWHQTMPPEAFMYAVPYEWYEKYNVRCYGFHGTSHLYCAKRAAVLLGKENKDTNVIILHIGNGASACAVKNGVFIDTSMGLTPLEGLVMGTRCGDIDPAIVTYIREKENLPQGKANEILNKKSGVLGISGVSSDFRDIEEAVAEGNERAALALKVFAHKVRFYIGAYIAEMNGVDAIIFTAGVGENDVTMREIICNNLGNLGIKLDPVKNKVRGKEVDIATEDSRVRLLLIPTNEELMIARDTFNIVTGRM